MKKLSNTEAELKKALLMKKKTYINPLIPNVPFWSPWKHQKTKGFQGDQIRTLGSKGLKH